MRWFLIPLVMIALGAILLYDLLPRYHIVPEVLTEGQGNQSNAFRGGAQENRADIIPKVLKGGQANRSNVIPELFRSEVFRKDHENRSCRRMHQNGSRPLDFKCFPYLYSIRADRELKKTQHFPWRERSFRDGKPALIPTGSYGTILCISQKVASTFWKRLISHNYDICTRKTCETRVHSGTRNPSLLVSAEHVSRLANFSGEFTPRIVLSRNPYNRLLSAYLSKYFESRKNKIGVPLPGTRSEVPFERTVTYMYLKFKRLGGKYWKRVDPHFSPQTVHCGINTGFAYDFYLRLEEQNRWFHEVADLLLLTNSSRYEALHGGNSAAPQSDTAQRSYYSKDLRKMVYAMFQKDFEFFGYAP